MTASLFDVSSYCFHVDLSLVVDMRLVTHGLSHGSVIFVVGSGINLLGHDLFSISLTMSCRYWAKLDEFQSACDRPPDILWNDDSTECSVYPQAGNTTKQYTRI